MIRAVIEGEASHKIQENNLELGGGSYEFYGTEKDRSQVRGKLGVNGNDQPDALDDLQRWTAPKVYWEMRVKALSVGSRKSMLGRSCWLDIRKNGYGTNFAILLN